MKAFIDLSLEDQAVIVLVQILDDVAAGKRTQAGIEHHLGDLYNLVGAAFDVSTKEVQKVTEAVAKYGVRMLPAYEEDEDDGGTPEGNTGPRPEEIRAGR